MYCNFSRTSSKNPSDREKVMGSITFNDFIKYVLLVEISIKIVFRKTSSKMTIFGEISYKKI